MNTGIEIKQIRNGALQKLAGDVDASHKKDGYIDSSELTVFTSKANELPQGSYSEDDFAQVMGLFKTTSSAKTERASLSWGEIGKTALKSVGNFFKGMFCDEEGFSLTRTLTTVETIGLLAGAAPLAAALGASSAVVGGIALGAKVLGVGLAGYMAIDGGTKLVKGTSKYYDSKTHEEAQQAMNEAMEGGVETAFSLPALFGIFKANNKGVKIAKEVNNKSAGKSSEITRNEKINEKTESLQSGSAQNNKVSKTESSKQNKTKETNTNVKKEYQSEEFYNKSGTLTKEVLTDANGKKHTIEYKYDKDGFEVISTTEYYEPGYIYESHGFNKSGNLTGKSYPEGMLKETTFENGLRKEVSTDGKELTTKWYDRHNDVIKVEYSTPDKNSIIKIEQFDNGNKTTYTYADGHTVESIYNRNTGWYDDKITYPDGSVEIKPKTFRFEIQPFAL